VAITPPLLAGLVDGVLRDADLAGFRHPLEPRGRFSDPVEPPGRFSDPLDEYRDQRRSWHGGLIGMLVVRASQLPALLRSRALDGLSVALVADTGIDGLPDAVQALGRSGVPVRRVEAAVAKRGENPLPGLERLASAAGRLSRLADATGYDPVTVHAEIPLASGLFAGLDALATGKPGPDRLAATFRLGGLAAELFPSPATLSGVIGACRDRGVAFTVNAGVRRAVRHSDPETGFTHHGVLNVLAACRAAAAGAPLNTVADRLATADPVSLVESVRAGRNAPRPLLMAVHMCRIADLFLDLTTLGVLSPH
jgi:hypothetical protein